MKKIAMIAAGVVFSALSSASHAGCGEWGPVNYIYASSSTVNGLNFGSILAIVNGTACSISGSGTDMLAAAAVLQSAKSGGFTAYIDGSTNSVVVGTEINL